MFLQTFGITNRRIDYAIRHKKLANTNIAEQDKRGKKTPTDKTPTVITEMIKEHISKISKPLHPERNQSQVSLSQIEYLNNV